MAERDAWRQLLARTVDALVYPGVYRRLRRTASLAASPTFVPKCVAQVGGAIWVGCDGLRVAVLDTLWRVAPDARACFDEMEPLTDVGDVCLLYTSPSPRD